MIIPYLKYRRITIFLYLFVIIFFPVVHYLYGLPMKSIVYSVEIVSFLFLLCGLYDFSNFIKRHNNLISMKKELNIYTANFREPSNLIEYDFQEIVRELYRQTTEAMGKIEAGYQEQIDYYTMWVHQIKTPIAAIRLLLQNGGSRNSDTLMLEEELFKIEQYVEMVLHYLRIESMSSDLQLHKVDLDAIIKSTVRKYSTIFIHKKLSLQYEDVHIQVLSDEKWCTFLVEQILSNALKYTNTGGIKIYIEEVNIKNNAEEEDRVEDQGRLEDQGKAAKKKSTEENQIVSKKLSTEVNHIVSKKLSTEVNHIISKKLIKEEAYGNEQHQVKLVIEDSGIGIRKEDIERIFDKGFTGYNGRWDKKASGIGLYLCDKVAKKIAHKIEIESEVSKGTIVKITFPNSNIEVF